MMIEGAPRYFAKDKLTTATQAGVITFANIDEKDAQEAGAYRWPASQGGQPWPEWRACSQLQIVSLHFKMLHWIAN
ncbi:hypothetical protein [Trinickia dinghuensis]|uniref:Uncharacterized protein n=1 Tax=Trinickia dinghuensis TaxID=2291023 RepID=A0A3D8JYG9_9BURK|nr:hypothetical protein [Trinickia dinghuensis]RDU97862.1 hypothetical protein DWV00_15015 [Trinickia dinghuensis]